MVGTPQTFAVESVMTAATNCLSQRGLGFFVIHVNGRRYGVCEPDATMLGVSFGEVGRRVKDRGKHTAPFAALDCAEIATSLIEITYDDVDLTGRVYFGIPVEDLQRLMVRNWLTWAPEGGDEAFDDGSWVYQFDVGDRVRIIAFRRQDDGRPDFASLSDLWLPADEFYEILQHWHQNFESEWAAAPKTLDERESAE